MRVIELTHLIFFLSNPSGFEGEKSSKFNIAKWTSVTGGKWTKIK